LINRRKKAAADPAETSGKQAKLPTELPLVGHFKRDGKPFISMRVKFVMVMLITAVAVTLTALIAVPMALGIFQRINTNPERVEARLESCMHAFFDKESSGDWLWREKSVAMALRGHEANRGHCEGLMIVKLPEKNGDFLLRQALEDKFRWGGTKMYYPMGTRMGWIE
jgi:hypothetical protein